MTQSISLIDRSEAQPDPIHGFELPPPPPPLKKDWKRALRLFRVVGEDPTRTEAGIELVEAMGGFGDGRVVERLAATPEGRKLLVQKPCLASVMADRDALAAMPDGSFGRAYLAFAEENGFEADGLIQARDRALGDVTSGLDEYRAWFNDRMSAAHDLQHVLTGYGTDVLGEAALLAFMRGQGTAGPALLVLTTLSLLFGKMKARAFFLRARWRGHRATNLALIPYEELLPLRLETLRDLLGLQQTKVAHPQGILRMVDDEVVVADESKAA